MQGKKSIRRVDKILYNWHIIYIMPDPIPETPAGPPPVDPVAVTAGTTEGAGSSIAQTLPTPEPVVPVNLTPSTPTPEPISAGFALGEWPPPTAQTTAESKVTAASPDMAVTGPAAGYGLGDAHFTKGPQGEWQQTWPPSSVTPPLTPPNPNPEPGFHDAPTKPYTAAELGQATQVPATPDKDSTSVPSEVQPPLTSSVTTPPVVPPANPLPISSAAPAVEATPPPVAPKKPWWKIW